MRSLVSRTPLWASVAGAIAIIATGCSSPGGTAEPAKPKPPISARQAITLSAHNVASWRSDSSTVTITGTDGGARISFDWALREESGFNESTVISYKRDGKEVIPGGSNVVVTPTLYYIRDAALSRYYHTTKPWVELPPAAYLTVDARISAKMRNSVPGAFFGDPILGVGLLTTSTDVRAVGAGSINGVPVTEYEGAYSAASGLAYITATLGSALSAQANKQVKAIGLTTVRFRAWLDPQQRPLKLVLIEAGTHANLTVTQTIVSINQPANIQFPPASETYIVPGTS